MAWSRGADRVPRSRQRTGLVSLPGVSVGWYVPAQYDGKTEVSLMVFNDGATYTQPDGYYRAVNVLDNLIYRGELPVMIAAFIDPGKFVKDGVSNRQAEYDPPDDRYSRVIVDELLPRLYADTGLPVIRIATPSPAGARAQSRHSRWRGSEPTLPQSLSARPPRRREHPGKAGGARPPPS